MCRRYELGATKKFAGVLDAEVNGGEEVNRARQFGSCVFTPRPTENGGVVTRTSVPPFFGRVRSPARSSVGTASKMIVLMPRLRKRPPARPRERRAGGREGRWRRFLFPTLFLGREKPNHSVYNEYAVRERRGTVSELLTGRNRRGSNTELIDHIIWECRFRHLRRVETLDGTKSLLPNKLKSPSPARTTTTTRLSLNSPPPSPPLT